MAVWFVKNSGDDANPGTAALPKATLNSLGGVIAAGDTIYVGGGSTSPSDSGSYPLSALSTQIIAPWDGTTNSPALDPTSIAAALATAVEEAVGAAGRGGGRFPWLG